MQYNSHATNQDVVSEVLLKCGGATVTNYPLVDITRRFNFGLDWYFGLAFLHGKGWKFDDFNQTSPPIDTYNITSGTNRYKLSDFTADIMGVIRLEILDSNGKGISLNVDHLDMLDNGVSGNESGRINWINKDTFQEKYVNADSGVPTSYIKYGDYIYFDKKPNYTKASGILLYVFKPASYMLSTDTTKVPGVPLIHIEHLCEYASLPYRYENKLITLSEKRAITKDMEDIIANYFGQLRSQEKKQRIGVRQDSCR